MNDSEIQDAGGTTVRLCKPLCLAILAVALTGCPQYDRYEVKLKPDGNALERELTCWRERSVNGKAEVKPFLASTLTEIEKAYGQPPVQDRSQRFRFNGRFTGRMPQDIGGSGTHAVLESPLGDLYVYVERFRGNDDLAGQLQRLAKATDRLTDLLLGWFETQMRQDASWPKVRGFLDGELRRDLNNMALYIWLGRADAAAHDPIGDTGDPSSGRVEMDSAFASTVARLDQYLIDHGYLNPNEYPKWAAVLLEYSPESWREFASLIQRRIAEKAKLEPGETPSLAFLSNPTEVVDSFNGYLRQTPDFEQLQQARRGAGQSLPDPKEMIVDLLVDEILHFDVFGEPDVLHVSLAMNETPLATNGRWDEATRLITWKSSIAAESTVPTLCFATWSRPDVEFQERHFGRVVLRGSELAEYVSSYCVLDSERRATIDRLVEGLGPSVDLRGTIQRFQAEQEQKNSIVAGLAESLSKALGADRKASGK